MTIWTIGHSTRGIDDFIEVLRAYGIEMLVDVRTVPRSRANPQFNKDELSGALTKHGIKYVHEKSLGGLRHPKPDSPNTGWHNESFRGFADYMQTREFSQAIDRLMETASAKQTAIMCAEMLPWRCHRSLIADALMARGGEVVEIFDKEKSRLHEMTPFAVVEWESIVYPEQESDLKISVCEEDTLYRQAADL
ncbi:MAG TPA: DUF488 domain-containing protein, partial [Armatimonadota bacterium]|nr:DUF488 domain-containing protein [Armatimonadota bacterium]